MTSRSPRARRVLAVLLAVAIVATGVPWAEVHSHAASVSTHEHSTATEHDAALEAHLKQHPHDGGDSDGQHVHEHGLFGQCPGVSLPMSNLLLNGGIVSSFPEPSVLHLHSHNSPLLRPPARA